jgi:tetratricopeptide (TPR) repeat protein
VKEVIRLAKDAIETDSTNGDGYLFLADIYAYRGRQDEVVSVFTDGLKNVPNDVRVIAQYAAHTASLATKADVMEKCEKVTSSPDVSRNSYFACGKAVERAEENALAEAYYLHAIKNDEKLIARVNDLQFGSPEHEYVNLMVKDGRGKDAASALESALLNRGHVTYLDWELLASLQTTVADYEGAAKYYGIAASRSLPFRQFTLKLKQVMSLAMAGKTEESLHLAEILFATSTKKQVLRLQVQLRNGTQKDLVITGIFDDQTKKALSTCIREIGCFAGVASVTGQAI